MQHTFDIMLKFAVICVRKELLKGCCLHCLSCHIHPQTSLPQLFHRRFYATSFDGNRLYCSSDSERVCKLADASKSRTDLVEDNNSIHGNYMNKFELEHRNEVLEIAKVLSNEGIQPTNTYKERLENLRHMLNLHTRGNLQEVVTKNPSMLMMSYETLSDRLELVGEWFSERQLTRVIRTCPAVMTSSEKDVSDKYKYVRLRMGVLNKSALVEAAIFAYPIEHIVTRHQCLLRAGLYETPDSRGRTSRVRNPHLNKILASYDRFFLHRVCRKAITMAEFTTFRRMVAAEGIDKFLDFENIGVDVFENRVDGDVGDDDDDDDDVDDDEGVEWELARARGNRRAKTKFRKRKK